MALLTLVSLLTLSLAKFAAASPCVAFDVNMNLYGFGFNGKDYNAGTQDTWSSSTKATDVTASGRPPFDGSNTTCYLAQFFNAIYVLGADSKNPSSVYIFDAGSKSWSTQSVTAGSFDPSSFDAILDHDTNVFYALSHGELFSLDMASLTKAGDTALQWTDVESTPYGKDYSPVMALAQNHIHFLDVPGVDAGSADIFVIHFSFFQPEAQSYPISGGGNMPATHGQTTSLFQTQGVQQEFVFVPDDASATYVVNVENNSTQALAGPTSKDSKATYFGGITSIVQLDSTGAVSYLPYNQNDSNANKAASWSSVGPLLAAAPPSSTSSPSNSAVQTGSANSTATGSASGSKSSTGAQAANGAMSIGVVGSVLSAAVGLSMLAFSL
ncbi:hypothetical protein PLICRDRAFT_105622 [Plicaturopsis crispa FD-325 SS-3]|nr:hypothetical protein PLICRDRAFT_105622 [Plicaturopsis crispa FD-325 SS-3]